MDHQRFDALTIALASGSSRRQALRLFAAGAVAGLLPGRFRAAAAPALQDDGVAILGWPFEPNEGQWTIVNGYRGARLHAPEDAGTPNPGRFAFDFARCPADGVDAQRGICAIGEDGGLFDRGGGEPGWDRDATVGATVLSPVTGSIAFVGELTPTCRYVEIDIAGYPGYKVLLANVDGPPTEGTVERGTAIGQVASGTCGEDDPGGYLFMLLFRQLDGGRPDAAAEPEGLPFDGEWSIDGCAYPDDTRSANQHRGQLVPCAAASATTLAPPPAPAVERPQVTATEPPRVTPVATAPPPRTLRPGECEGDGDCTGGKTCQSGQCRCVPGWGDCAGLGICGDMAVANDHCGACGVLCTGGKTCQGGECLCAPGWGDCAGLGLCGDMAVANDHCGRCGNLCTGKKTCVGGQCQCAPGWGDCAGLGICGDMAVANDHCGRCGVLCTGGKTCQGGQCQCPQGWGDCAGLGICGDMAVANDHCGACGVLCTGGKTCVGGQCQCAPGWGDCAGLGLCGDMAVANDHCGACGVLCPSGTTCQGGVCR